MYGQNPNWLWSNGEPLRHHRHLGRLGSATLRQWEDEEEGKEEEHAIWTREHPAICCYTTNGHGLTQERVQNPWGWACTESTFGPVHTDLVSIQSQSDTGLDAPEMWIDVPPHQPSLGGADGEESSQHCLGSQWRSHRTEGHGCVCVHGPSGPGRCCHSLAGSPLFNFGMRKTIMVGVEVEIVEEVAYEDTETLEVISEGVYPNYLMETILMHDDQLFAT
ncbi:uncharacterized protein LOC112228948 isoform X2 [Oncorhynchus tshawytscha]|uniref:uncharacterized protein LOC112228948 isoform X2 n=1 Tax=Oncorhynchus tshawytscha TaxID=74940 RepID=UPI000D0A27F1|nr:uncharacterized protein LOC112228948 isoform X2 [Oncorhynchus tshawytscha]